eukprot:5961716-Pleurochrysis_carterae.AAC.1
MPARLPTRAPAAHARASGADSRRLLLCAPVVRARAQLSFVELHSGAQPPVAAARTGGERSRT